MAITKLNIIDLTYIQQEYIIADDISEDEAAKKEWLAAIERGQDWIDANTKAREKFATLTDEQKYYLKKATAQVAQIFYNNGGDYTTGSFSLSMGGVSISETKDGATTIPSIVRMFLEKATVIETTDYANQIKTTPCLMDDNGFSGTGGLYPDPHITKHDAKIMFVAKKLPAELVLIGHGEYNLDTDFLEQIVKLNKTVYDHGLDIVQEKIFSKDFEKRITTNKDKTVMNALLIEAIQKAYKPSSRDGDQDSRLNKIEQLINHSWNKDLRSERFVCPANIAGVPVQTVLGSDAEVLLTMKKTTLTDDIQIDASSRFYLQNDAEHFTIEGHLQYFYLDGVVKGITINAHMNIEYGGNVLEDFVVELGSASDIPNKMDQQKYPIQFKKTYNKDFFRARAAAKGVDLKDDSIQGLTVAIKGWCTGTGTSQDARVGMVGENINRGWMEFSKDVGQSVFAQLKISEKIVDLKDTPDTIVPGAHLKGSADGRRTVWDKIHIKEILGVNLALDGSDENHAVVIKNMKITSEPRPVAGIIPKYSYDLIDFPIYNSQNVGDIPEIVSTDPHDLTKVEIQWRPPIQYPRNFHELGDTPPAIVPDKKLVTKLDGGQATIQFEDDTFVSQKDTTNMLVENTRMVVTKVNGKNQVRCMNENIVVMYDSKGATGEIVDKNSSTTMFLTADTSETEKSFRILLRITRQDGSIYWAWTRWIPCVTQGSTAIEFISEKWAKDWEIEFHVTYSHPGRSIRATYRVDSTTVIWRVEIRKVIMQYEQRILSQN